ncbi:MAG: bifunctional phosphoribosylaminoimidazolecarboxamide formyltransferase/IMP cyclohydrolase [Ignavibacteriales bacterium]|nr:bifunctional phosphoribosylaminoimidazolecarboxamide formyltransferase/IMP cyclohydrolase [Ignavibacteriales bacterium]
MPAAGGEKENNLLIQRALLSVSDKTGIVEFAKALEKFGIEIISTGGTFRTLSEAGLRVTPVSEVTGFPEILDGRVKTLHPNIHAALLAALDDPRHIEELKKLGIRPIDLVVANLYPFEETVARPGVSEREVIENIDIGGPAMVRASAKNFRHTAVVVNPERYDSVLAELEAHQGALTESMRYRLAQEAFQQTTRYDAAVAGYLASRGSNEGLPSVLTIAEPRSFTLRYGENPHQLAGFYGALGKWIEQIHGKVLSYNNLLDLDAALGLVGEFDRPAAVVVKHTNPCGAGTGHTLLEAYRHALATDSKSAFGGIVALNREVDSETADALNEIFLEAVVAPSFSQEAMVILQRKKERRLILQKETEGRSRGYDVRRVGGGFLVQETDVREMRAGDVKTVTKRKPTEPELQGLLFAWTVAKHVKSNAIVYARGDRTLGVGAGQMSRVDSAKIASLKATEAGLDLRGCSVASDAFFPFADGLLEAVKVGATAVIQPGGSVRDEEVIRAADDHHIAMVFTGVRHFRH